MTDTFLFVTVGWHHTLEEGMLFTSFFIYFRKKKGDSTSRVY